MLNVQIRIFSRLLRLPLHNTQLTTLHRYMLTMPKGEMLPRKSVVKSKFLSFINVPQFLKKKTQTLMYFVFFFTGESTLKFLICPESSTVMEQWYVYWLDTQLYYGLLYQFFFYFFFLFLTEKKNGITRITRQHISVIR